MTNEEKQEIINAVLSAIMTNSKTIEQLTPTESLSDDDAIEVSGGRRISYAAFFSAVQEGVQLMLDGYLTGEAAVAWFAALENNPANYVDAPNNPVQLHWRQSPIVLLDSMGEDLDGDDDFTAQVGDKWWDPTSSTTKNYIFLKTSTGQGGWPIGSGNVNDVLYVNKRTGRMYLWNGTDMVELVGATGGGGSTVTITKGGGYVDIDIIDNTPVIEVSTQSIVMSGDNKTATFTVSGHNLTAPIKINGNNAYFSKSPRSISPVGGVVEATTVTVTFGGDSDDTDDLIVSSVGAASKTVHVAYTAVAGPNIVVSPATLSFKAATNQTQTKQVAVQGTLLTGDVEVTAGGAFQVSLQSGSGFANSVTIPKASALAGITVYVRYTAGSSATTGTLTLTSDGAADKTVDLTGAVVSLTVSESSLSFNTTVGTPVTQTFTVRGANLSDDISISASGTGFSVSPANIDKDDAGTAQTVTVTYNPSAAGTNTGTVTIQSSGLSEQITLSGTAVGIPEVDGEGKFTATVGGKDFYCKVISGTTNVEIHNSGYITGYNATLPSEKYSGDVVVPSKVTAIYNNVATEFTVVKLAANSFKSCSGLTSLTLPNTLTEIALCAINDCSNNSFTSLVIPNSVTTLGLCPVYKCQKLTSLVIGTGVDTLTNYFGAGCLSLSSINIPDNVTQINDYCFSGGAGNDGKIYFDTVSIGSGLTKISGNSKFRMKAGSAVTINRATPPTLNGTVFVDTSGSTPCGATLYVPSGKVGAYQGNSAYATQFGTSNIQEIQ